MTNLQKPVTILANISVAAMLINCPVNAGGFSLYTENSGAAVGNFAAGVAAEGADAVIGWYNPAGLILLKEKQVVFSGVGALPSAELTGTSTFLTQNPGGPPLNYVQTYQGLQSGKDAVIPSIHYAMPLGNRAALGLSMIAPVGLSSSYDYSSPVRYEATNSSFETINISPELAAKFTDHLALGVGLDFQYAKMILNEVIGSPALMSKLPQPPTILDSTTYNVGSSVGFGFHAGMLLMFQNNHTRFGLNYESSISHQFYGSSQLVGRLADPALNIFHPNLSNPSARFRTDGLYTDPISVPYVITLSGYQDLNDKWALLGSVVYTGWNLIQSISLNNVAASAADEHGFVRQVLVNATSPEYYHNTWRFALGANYHVNEKWMMRMGGGYDQTPTANSVRDVRLPDSSRCALAIGTHYQYRPNLGFDVGYAYLFATVNSKINNTTAVGPTSTYNVNALTKDFGQMIGLQVVWTPDKGK